MSWAAPTVTSAPPARIVHSLGGKRFDCDAPIRRPARDTPGRPRETGSPDHRSRCADSLETRRSHAHVHQFPPPTLVQRLTAPCGSGPRRSSGVRCFRHPVRPRTAQRAPDTEVLPRALSRVNAQLLGPPTTTAASSAPHPDVVHREQFDRCHRCQQPPHRRHGRRDSCPAAQRPDARADGWVRTRGAGGGWSVQCASPHRRARGGRFRRRRTPHVRSTPLGPHVRALTAVAHELAPGHRLSPAATRAGGRADGVRPSRSPALPRSGGPACQAPPSRPCGFRGPRARRSPAGRTAPP